METEKGKGEDNEKKRGAEDEAVKITNIEQGDLEVKSKHLRLTAALLRWQRLPQRHYWRLAGVVSLLLLLIVLLRANYVSPAFIIESFRRAFAPQALTPHSGSGLPILPQRDGITCLRDAIWSPDSTFIAVLGYSQNCSQEAYVPGLVNLYDAHTSKLMRQLHPDAAIERALNRSLASLRLVSPEKQGGSQQVISYTHVVWSPDSQRLAITFHLLAPSPWMEGVVLMNRDGGHMQVLLQQQKSGTPSYREWDGERSTSIISKTFLLPPALTYHWGPHGTVIPERLLPSGTLPAAPPLAAIGNPDGDPSFTLWQPALTHEKAVYSSYASTTHIWSTSFAAWSPDGRYLITDLSFWGVLDSAESISAGNQFVTVISLDQAARDTAPPKVIETTREISHQGDESLTNRCATVLRAMGTPLAFAWSPNGRVLADYGAGNGVDLYDCSTGHKLTSFSLRSKYTAPSADAVALRWSPDGSHLLLASVAFGVVSLWKFDPPLR